MTFRDVVDETRVCQGMMGAVYWNLSSLPWKPGIENMWFVEILGFQLDYYLRSYSTLAAETSGHFLLVFLDLFSTTVSVPLLNRFLLHSVSRLWSHECQKSDLQRVFFFFLAVSWIGTKGPLCLLYVLVSSVELPWGDSSADSAVSNCPILLGSIACWGWQLCIDDKNDINFQNQIP